MASDEDSLVEHELDLSNDAEIVAEQDGGAACTEMADAGHDIEVSSAGGEVISACSAAPDKPSKAAPSIVHLDPPKNLAKAGYGAYRWRAGMSSLRSTGLLWMSGECGLYVYIVLSILAASSDLWFHAHSWAIGSDERPRLLQSDGTAFLHCQPG